jgi:hypothetical protein
MAYAAWRCSAALLDSMTIGRHVMHFSVDLRARQPRAYPWASGGKTPATFWVSREDTLWSFKGPSIPAQPRLTEASALTFEAPIPLTSSLFCPCKISPDFPINPGTDTDPTDALDQVSSTLSADLTACEFSISAALRQAWIGTTRRYQIG